MVVARWTQAVERRIMVSEGRAAQVIATLDAALVGDGSGVDTLLALAKTLPDKDAAAPRQAALDLRGKLRAGGRSASGDQDTVELFRHLPEAETTGRLLPWREAKKPMLAMKGSQADTTALGYRETVAPDGLVTVRHRGGNSSGGSVEEMALLRAAYLARQRERRAFVVVGRRDTAWTVDTTYYGTTIRKDPGGFETEIDAVRRSAGRRRRASGWAWRPMSPMPPWRRSTFPLHPPPFGPRAGRIKTLAERVKQHRKRLSWRKTRTVDQPTFASVGHGPPGVSSRRDSRRVGAGLQLHTFIFPRLGRAERPASPLKYGDQTARRFGSAFLTSWWRRWRSATPAPRTPAGRCSASTARHWPISYGLRRGSRRIWTVVASAFMTSLIVASHVATAIDFRVAINTFRLSMALWLRHPRLCRVRNLVGPAEWSRAPAFAQRGAAPRGLFRLLG